MEYAKRQHALRMGTAPTAALLRPLERSGLVLRKPFSSMQQQPCQVSDGRQMAAVYRPLEFRGQTEKFAGGKLPVCCIVV